MNNTLKQHAHTLRLSGLLESLELRLQEAEANRLPYAQFLELLFQDEINVRHQRFIERRQKLADFRELRSLENFDFQFNPGTQKSAAEFRKYTDQPLTLRGGDYAHVVQELNKAVDRAQGLSM